MKPSVADRLYDRDLLRSRSNEVIASLRFNHEDKSKMRGACRHLMDALDRCQGTTLQQRWHNFEKTVWPAWASNIDRPCTLWTGGARVLVPARIVVPSLEWICDLRVNQWVVRFPENDALVEQHRRLLGATAGIRWASPHFRQLAVSNGLRLLLVRGYQSLSQIQDEDLKTLSAYSKGANVLDAALCALGIFARSPKHGATRHSRRRPLTVAELVKVARTPAAFREIMVVYLETYAARVSDSYTTRRAKSISIAHFWRFLGDKHPELTSPAQVRPLHLREYIPHIMAHALTVRRGNNTEQTISSTAHSWLTDLRTFFSDLCTWALEPESPFAPFAPPTVPLTRHSLLGLGFDKARERTRARITATVLDLEREMPAIRSFALRRWNDATARVKTLPPS
jgi:hypothetical protein